MSSDKIMCNNCEDFRWVCENHPNKPWLGLSNSPFGCECGAGTPCTECNGGENPDNGEYFVEGKKQ